MNRGRHLAVLLGGLLAAATIVAPATAATPPGDARAVVQRSDDATKSRTEHVTYRMELLGPEGAVEQTRESDYYFKREGGEERTLERFTEPPVLRGSGLLIVDEGRALNDIWVYVPASRTLRRIAGAEKSNRYMGTEFAYEDFEDYKIPFYDFSGLRTEACGGEEACHVVEAVPATEEEREASGYGRKIYWIGQDTLYARRIEYYDKDARHVKTLTADDFEKVDGYWRPQRLLMRNNVTGRETRITILSRAVDEPLKDYYVSRRYLRKD